jgi:hypothetical protein
VITAAIVAAVLSPVVHFGAAGARHGAIVFLLKMVLGALICVMVVARSSGPGR